MARFRAKSKAVPSPLSIAAAMPQRREVDEIRVALPIPPSVNRLWAPNGAGGIRRTAAYEQWLKDAGWGLQTLRPRLGRIGGPYDMVIDVPVSCRTDVDNLPKGVGDLMQAHGCIRNDRDARSVFVRRTTGSEFIVTITRVP